METLIDEVRNNSNKFSNENVQQLLAIIANLDTGSHKVRSLLKHDVVSASNGNGMALLSSSLPFLSKDDLIEKLPQFVSTCLKFCKSTDGDRNAAIGYKVFQQVVERCDGSPETERALNNQVFGEFFSTLCSCACSANGDHAALSCLETVLRRFSRHCSGHRVAIEKYLVRFFDSENGALVIRAATCAALVQQIRFSGEQGIDAKSSWSEHYLSLCAATEALSSSLFTTFMDINRRGQLFQLSADASAVSRRSPGPLRAFLNDVADLSNSAGTGEESNCGEDASRLSKVERHSRLNQRLRNVLVYLQAALVTAYPTAKAVNPHSLLEPVFRLVTLSKSGCRANSSLDDILAETFLPGLKISALRTLDALLECLQASVLPYSKLFFNLTMLAIRHGSSARKLRIQAYRTLKRWLEVVKCHNFSDPNASTKSDISNTPEDELVAALLDDIVLREKGIVLTVTAKSDLKNLSKKAKRRLTNQQLLTSSLAKHAPGLDGRSADCALSSLEIDVRISALNCLQTVMLTSGCFLKETSHKKIQNALVHLAFYTESSSAESLALYSCLEACVLGCKLGLPAPTQYAFKIFSEGICNPDQRLASFCARALRNVRSSIHYSLPTLLFAAAPSDDRDGRSEKGESDEGKNPRKLPEKRQSDVIMPATSETTNPSAPPSKRPRRYLSPAKIRNVSTQIDVTTIELNDSDADNNVVELDDTDDSSSVIDDEVELTPSPVLHSQHDKIKSASEKNNPISTLQYIPLETSNSFAGNNVASDAISKKDTSNGVNVAGKIINTFISASDRFKFCEIGKHKAPTIGDKPDEIINEGILISDNCAVVDAEVVFGDANERSPLSFPIAKALSSQESSHSDDLVITCGQNGVGDDEKAASAPGNDEAASGKLEPSVAGISIGEMLETFVDEVNVDEQE